MNTSVNIEHTLKNINSLIKEATKANKWVDSFLQAEKAERSHSKLVDIRRSLKKIAYAFTQNPSAAVYGESQVGKSYLIKNLLSLPKEEFIIVDESTGTKYNFLEEINPKGDGVEATSVVTRFSANVEIPNANYPILIKILGPKDIALLLIDSCLSELRDSLESLKPDDINKVLDELREEYMSKAIHQQVFTEDDICDIKDYLDEYFRNSIVNSSLRDSDFWKDAPKLIERMPYHAWHRLLQVIWGNNQYISEFFNLMNNELFKLNFADVAYCKFEAVLREHGTLLDVNRLHQLSDKDAISDAKKHYIPNVDLWIQPKNSNGKVHSINKSHLCALTAELIFKLEDRLKSSKKFISNLDLLDFPGARARKELKQSVIEEEISSMILRGKVAYIFNKYSSEYLISNLLFCNRSMQIETPYIPRLLDNWIGKYIGNSPEDRERFLSEAQVPPLFVIYTWFNADLMYNSTNDQNRKSLEDKWAKRFNRIFEKEIVTENYTWDKNWRVSDKYFRNQYMLRDLMLSEEKSNLFSGYAIHKEEKEQNIPANYRGDYWADLKDSFVKHPFVQNHFQDPELAWKESATRNQDGSEPIIRNLSISSEHDLRTPKFIRELKQLATEFIEELSKHYHSDESDQLIFNAIEKAGRIQLDLDTTFGKDPYFFGRLINEFLISEGEIFNLYRSKLNDIARIHEADRSEYAVIRLKNPEISINASFDDNVEVLRKFYALPTAEKVKENFEKKHIDLNELFYGEVNRIRNNSLYLAEELMKYYKETFLVPERFENFIKEGFSGDSTIDLLANLEVSFENVEITELIAKSIRKYVDRYDKIDKVQEMIADISAAIINKFINTMGYEYYTEDDLNSMKKANKEHELGLVFEHGYLNFEPLAEQDLLELFDTLDNLDKILNEVPIKEDSIKNVPSFSHYVKWSDFMKLSFVSNCDIPTYDILANNELGGIIKEVEPFPTLFQ